MYAVNLADALTLKVRHPIAYMAMVRPVLTGDTVETERGRGDGIGVLVMQDVDAERFEAIREVLKLKGIQAHQFRCYQGSGKTWKRLP